MDGHYWFPPLLLHNVIQIQWAPGWRRRFLGLLQRPRLRIRVHTAEGG